MTRSTSARLAGSAYFFYMAVGLGNEALMHRATDADGTAAIIARIAEHTTALRLAILLKPCECLAALVLAVALYGITRDEDHELATLGMICRVAEGVFVASFIPTDLGLLWLANVRAGVGAPDTATTNALSAFLLMPGGAIGAIFFALGSTIFSYLLLRGRMVPSWLAQWGVFSSVLLVVGLPLQLAGFFTGPLTGYQWVPAIIFAPVLGLWLLVKGVAPLRVRETAGK